MALNTESQESLHQAYYSACVFALRDVFVVTGSYQFLDLKENKFEKMAAYRLMADPIPVVNRFEDYQENWVFMQTDRYQFTFGDMDLVLFLKKNLMVVSGSTISNRIQFTRFTARFNN